MWQIGINCGLYVKGIAFGAFILDNNIRNISMIRGIVELPHINQSIIIEDGRHQPIFTDNKITFHLTVLISLLYKRLYQWQTLWGIFKEIITTTKFPILVAVFSDGHHRPISNYTWNTNDAMIMHFCNASVMISLFYLSILCRHTKNVDY